MKKDSSHYCKAYVVDFRMVGTVALKNYCCGWGSSSHDESCYILGHLAKPSLTSYDYAPKLDG